MVATRAASAVEWPLAALARRPVALAIDIDPAARSAVAVTATLAATYGAVPHLIHAIEPTMRPLRSVAAAARRAIAAELDASLGDRPEWPIHVELGHPARVIARRAATLGTELIVIGLRRHGAIDRLLHDETTLHVMRVSACPVLGVRPSLTGLACHAIVAVDFGHASVRAAHAAVPLVAAGGTLVLLYVEPRHPAGESDDEDVPIGDEDAIAYASGVDAAFDRLATDLLIPPTVHVECLRVDAADGDRVADRILTTADRDGADLLAIGSRRHDWLDRVLLGSVTRDLARDGRHSLLVVPPAPGSGPRRLDD